MQIITDSHLEKSVPQNLSIALGNFDGVHRGHQKIIQTAIELAERRGSRSLIFTFHPHPLQLLKGQKAPPLISTLTDRVEIIESLEPDFLFIKEFNQDFASLDHQLFVAQYLYKTFQATDVVVGKDFSFGAGGRGTVETLKAVQKEYGFLVKPLDTVKIDGLKVKSTLIRELILNGSMEEVQRLLGRPFSLSGPVIKGRGRGRMLGIPTANLNPYPHIITPPEGVYVVKVHLNEETYLGVANVGFCPTFPQDIFSIEIHLLAYTGDLYQQQLQVHFFKRIRGEIAFSSQEKLKEQVQRDMCFAQKYLSGYAAGG